MAGRLVTMSDIAELAAVRRPVVSVWRKRARGSAHPFPEAHPAAGGRELFDLAEVVDWLEATGRGNNPQLREDAVVHALWDADAPEQRRATAEALSALLVLRQLTGADLAGFSRDQLLDLADEQDPDDEFLYTEIAAAPQVEEAAVLAEELIEAAWGIREAHERVLDKRFRAGWQPLAQTALSADANRLMVDATVALRRDLGPEARLMDPTGCAVDLLAAAAAQEPQGVLLMRGSGPLHRLTRRQLLLAEVIPRSVSRDDAAWEVSGAALQLVVLPPGDQPGMPAIEQLDLVEEVQGQMDGRQVALVVGPAAVLTDPLTDKAARQRRDALLRTGGVRAIVRLPAGLVTGRPREHLALLLLADPDPLPVADRRTGVADLSSSQLTPRTGESLVADLLAASQGVAGARRRAWAHLAHVPTSELVSRSGSLVSRRRAPGSADARLGADWVFALRSADQGLELLEGLELIPSAAPATPVWTTFAQAIAEGWLKLSPGHRIDPVDLAPGQVRVLTADDVAAGRTQGSRRVDRYALLARADVRLTEPGDLVFVAGRAPAAMIDHDGDAVVLAPARVLRLNPSAPLVASSVAARIAEASPGSAWRGWRLPVLAEEATAPLTTALNGIAAERARAADRLARLDALTHDLTTAVESRRISIARKEPLHGPNSG